MRNYFSILLFVILPSVTFSQVNLNAGLVAYYPFNGNTLDASGNGNNATNFGATLTSDQWGNPNSAYQFNGSSDYMMVTSNATLQLSGFTLCARVKPLSFYNGPCFNNVIIAKGNSAGYGNGDFALTYTPTLNQNPSTYCFIQDSTHEDYRVYAGSTGAANSLSCINAVNGIPYVTTNHWDCVLGTYDSASHTASVYVNGVFRYSYLVNSPIGTNTQDVYIGKQNAPGYEYYVGGVLDELRIYNRVLNTQEIDSICNLVTISQTIINQYAAVNNYIPCSNSVVVDSASNFAIGDTVLLIQMKGVDIDSSNSNLFGNIINYNHAGNYEINVIQNIVGNTVYLQNALTRQYDIPNGKVQLVSVPTFANYNVNIPHTCMPWNGTKGGVFIINVLGNLNLNNDINVSGLGFRGGVSNIINSSVYNCSNFQFFDPPNVDSSAAKGEGVANISVSKSFARGKMANGGGGGNSHNAGGGGGSNANLGGIGGGQHAGCSSLTPNNTGGVGGLQLTYNNVVNKIFLGGGGGAGHSNNYYPSFPASNFYTSNGAPGGGIVIIRANTITSSGGSIHANGDNGYACMNTGASGICHDAMGGGGAGGTILLSSNNVIGTMYTECKGGDGGSVSAASGLGELGPGGGGSGGIVWYKGVTIPASVIINNTFGNNGVCTNYSSTAWGAQSGSAGLSLVNLVLPIDTSLYVPTLNFANAGPDTSICEGTNYQLNATGGVSYSWTPAATLSNSSIANPIATPSTTITYTVVVTDANGCTDSDEIKISVNSKPSIIANANPASVCFGNATTLTGSGGTSYIWSSGVPDGISFTPSFTTTYTVTGSDATNCTNTSTVTVTVIANPNIVITPINPVLCLGDSVQLTASGASTYSWSPFTDISQVGIANPFVYPNSSTTYFVTGTDASGCKGTANVLVEVVADPKLILTKSGDVECNIHTIQLHASGANSYTWTPSIFLSAPNSSTTNASMNQTTTFTVIGILGSCVITDSITVNSFDNDESSIFIPNAFSPNGDGLNDCLNIRNTANFTTYYFAIYNRWGQLVFESKSPEACWDGSFKTKPAISGSYYYFLRAETNCGKIFKKGDITLIR